MLSQTPPLKFFLSFQLFPIYLSIKLLQILSILMIENQSEYQQRVCNSMAQQQYFLNYFFIYLSIKLVQTLSILVENQLEYQQMCPCVYNRGTPTSSFQLFPIYLSIKLLQTLSILVESQLEYQQRAHVHATGHSNSIWAAWYETQFRRL